MADEPRPMEYETVVFGNEDSRKTTMDLPEEILSVGDILCDTYILRARLGRGGMGEVWRADEVYEGEILRTVVIKTLAPNVQNIQEELARIQSMFHKIHSLQHQHICPMYAMKNDPKAGTIIVMKYIDGMMLQEYYTQYMRVHNEFPVSEVVKLLMPIAQALDYSHSKKVLHRDVKPQNILVSNDESDGVQLIDFGLVMEMRSTMSGSTSMHFDGGGTLPYMSPEQWSGDFQDAKADQFSLAVVVYELLAGKLPFYGTNIQVLGFQILNKSPDPILNVPDYVNFALQKALAKNRKQRFDTCVNFIKALETSLITQDEVANLDAKAPELKKEDASAAKRAETLKKNLLPMLAGGGVALLLVLILLIFTLISNEPETQIVMEPGTAVPTPEIDFLAPPSVNESRNNSRTKTEPKKTAAPSVPKTSSESADEPKTVVPGTAGAAETPKNAENPANPATSETSSPTETPEKTETSTTPATAETIETAETTEAAEDTEPSETSGASDASDASSAPEPSVEELLTNAEKSFAAGDFAQAWKSFARCDVQKLGGDSLTHYSETAEKTGHYISATRSRSAELASSSDSALLRTAIHDAIEAGDFKQALAWSEQALTAAPDDRELLLLQARALNHLSGRIDDPAPARHALSIYNTLLESTPQTDAPARALLLAFRGEVYMHNPTVFSKAYDLAKADFEESLSLDSSCVSALLNQGILLCRVFGQKLTARNNFDAVLAQEPENMEALLEKGQSYVEERPEQALEIFTKYLEKRPEDWNAYQTRGTLYYNQKSWMEALSDFEKCVTADEKNFDARKYRALTAAQLKRWRDAKSDFDFLIANDTQPAHQVEYYQGLATVYEGANQRMKAQDALQKAESIRRTRNL